MVAIERCAVLALMTMTTLSGCEPSTRTAGTASTSPVVETSASPTATPPSSLASSPTSVSKATPASEELVARFIASDWSTVSKAAREIEARDDAPEIAMSLLGRTDSVPLTDTADLIYPGAKHFAGHGYVVNYDLDAIAGRAGWILEDVTFRRFGFAESAFPASPRHRPPTPRRSRRRAGSGLRSAAASPNIGAGGSARERRGTARGSRNAVDTVPGVPMPGFDRAKYDHDLHKLVEDASRSSDASVAHIADLLLHEGPDRAVALSKPAP